MNKRGIQWLARGQVFLLVMSVVAFSVILGEIGGVEGQEVVEVPIILKDGTVTGESLRATVGEVGGPPVQAPPQTQLPVKGPAEGVKEIASAGATFTSLGGGGSTGYNIATVGGENYLIKGVPEVGKQIAGINTVTGEAGKLNFATQGDLPVLTKASAIQNQLGGTQIALDSGTYNAAHVLDNPALAKELAGNSEALKQLGANEIRFTNGETVIDYGKGATTRIGPDGSITTTGEGSSFTSKLFGFEGGGWADAAASGLQWAVVAYFAGQMIGGMIFDDQKQIDAFSFGAAAAFGVGKFAHTQLAAGKDFLGFLPKIGGANAGLSAGIYGLAAGAIVFALMYKDTDTETVTFQCDPWEAPVGGSKCEECNEQPGDLPCSEYQCKSLGQACALINKGQGDEERCVWLHPDDVDPPIISMRSESLPADFRFTPDTAVSPPDRGVRILYDESEDGCIPAFTPFTFGVNTDEPAKCKIDYERLPTFDEMGYFFGGNALFSYNHTQSMSLPGPSATKNNSLIVENDGEYSLYVRCQDANGNHRRAADAQGNTNPANFVINFCVDRGPDTTPNYIVDTNIRNDMPISYNQTELDLQVYTNEPATCRWTRDNDKDYEDMEGSMACARSPFEMNARLVYTCETTLDGLTKDQNLFYFRCEDQPQKPTSDRNQMNEGYEFSVLGSDALAIQEIEPVNVTIRDSTSVVKVPFYVETRAGFNEGLSVCSYREAGDRAYIDFYYEGSLGEGHEYGRYEHEQDLFFGEGSYVYDIRCVDLGGNVAQDQVSFTVEVDTDSPQIVRAYREENFLNIVTSENSSCVYDTVNCKYSVDDGLTMQSLDERTHFVSWDTKDTYYIKCQDEYGNEPLPDVCSAIVRPTDFTFNEE